jgi:predicted transcriptional regulator
MEVHLSPDLEAKLDKWAAETGRPKEEFVEDALTGYFEELAQVRETLDSRYDDIKSGRVKPIDGEEVFARLREKSQMRRSNRK